MGSWQVQEAKSHFSEVLDKARTEGPQMITRHGNETAFIISAEDYRRMEGSKKSFGEYLLSAPKVDDFEMYLERDKDTGRDFTFDE